jgi:hypothetical protein
MSANAPNSLTIVLGVAVAMAIVAVLLLQSLGKTTIKDDDTCRRSYRRSDRARASAAGVHHRLGRRAERNRI